METDILKNNNAAGISLFSNRPEPKSMWNTACMDCGFKPAEGDDLYGISKCYIIIHADLRYELKQKYFDFVLDRIRDLKEKNIITKVVFSCTIGWDCTELNQETWVYAENEIRYLLESGVSSWSERYKQLENFKKKLLTEEFIWLFFSEMVSRESKSCTVTDTKDLSVTLQIILSHGNLRGYYNALANQGQCNSADSSFFDMTSLLYVSQKEEFILLADNMNSRIIQLKLRKIQLLEKQILLSVEEICKKYNISYFLAGGSLLGAVRHHGFIPWDDDLDIGMLRDDFEKFRKVCSEELPGEYIYQSWTKNDGSHYQFDKIRLKGTRLETKFSSQFEMHNGIFLDVLVYDKTSDVRILQWIHIKMLKWFAYLLRVRWFNYARKGKMYLLSVLLLPILRLFPVNAYNRLFEKIMRLFYGRPGKFLVDSAGQNIEKGVFPEAWLKKVEKRTFENTNIPVPVGAEEYLNHFYGSDYMEIPAMDKQDSGHIWKKIDLGCYIKFSNAAGVSDNV